MHRPRSSPIATSRTRPSRRRKSRPLCRAVAQCLNIGLPNDYRAPIGRQTPEHEAFMRATAGSSTSPASPAARDLLTAPPDCSCGPASTRPLTYWPWCVCKETTEASSFPFDGTHASERRSRSQQRRPASRPPHHTRMVSVLSVPNTLISSRRTLRLTATQPSVGEKLGRAICKKIALPAPGCVGFML